MPVAALATGIFILFNSFYLQAHSGHDKDSKPEVLAPGYRSLDYPAPVPGSYELPALGKAGNGEILDMNGNARQLHEFMGDKFVVLSFIYTQCDDVNGCPLATYVSSQVQNRLMERPSLEGQVRFISMSFDPKNDTPKVMSKYGKNFVRDGFDWQFLTTSSEAVLDPLLQAYDQSILREVDENGNTSGSISHILRVFLIDRENQIRNIYSTSFLHPETVINDIITLASMPASGAGTAATSQPPELHGASDNKDGYESADYSTRALSLSRRQGASADLALNARRAIPGLQQFPEKILRGLTREKIQLGRRLFFDRRLSHNNTFSCAMCHIPEQGFTSNELATAVGIEGRTVRRNAPTLYNVGHAELLFHDAREDSLERQIWGPLLARNEMANPSPGYLVNKIRSIPGYSKLFSQAFDGASATMTNIGDALAAYQRSLRSANSNFDRWYFQGDEKAVSSTAKKGFSLFKGKAACSGCHLVEQGYALFTDHSLHNTGIGYNRSMSRRPPTRKVLVAPGNWLEVDMTSIEGSFEAPPNDLGYYEISENPDDRWKYKTPSLRNIALTAPYMHDGSLSTLEEVIEFYDRGGIKNQLLDPLIKPLGLTPPEKSQLVAFLRSLTGDNVDQLISDAFAAPVGNTR